MRSIVETKGKLPQMRKFHTKFATYPQAHCHTRNSVSNGVLAHLELRNNGDGLGEQRRSARSQKANKANKANKHEAL